MLLQVSIAASPYRTRAAPPQSGGLLQRQCACGGTPGPTGACADCRRKKKLGLQPTLRVGRPGDRYEREADQVADQVMRTEAPPTAPLPVTPLVQRSGGDGAMTAPPEVDAALAAPGRPLGGATRQAMEQRFGHDFSQVRVHTDTRAAASAEAVQARAYTVGRDVVFGAGAYRPATAAGQRLLAHELVHTLQQGTAAGAVQRQQPAPQPAPTPGDPARLRARSPTSISFPTDDEATLDKRIKSRQQQDLDDGSGKRLGTVTYGAMPPDASARMAAKQALLDVITYGVDEWQGQQVNIRVPASGAPVERDYHMIKLRFDASRNVEVSYAGSDTQERGAFMGDLEAELAATGKSYGVTFVDDNLQIGKTTHQGKAWSADDLRLMQQALSLLGAKEKTAVQGLTVRRLAADQPAGGAGFYTNKDHSINMGNAALPISRDLWFGEGGSFYSFGVLTALHEIAHGIDMMKDGAADTTEIMDDFKVAVRAESKRKTGKEPGAAWPPPGIVMPTDYASKSWDEFFADAYAIYRLERSFLDTDEHRYLLAFFQTALP